MSMLGKIAAVKTDAIYGISTVGMSFVGLVHSVVSTIRSGLVEATHNLGIKVGESGFANSFARSLRVCEYRMAQIAAENAMVSGNPRFIEHATRVALLGAELRKL